MWLIYDLFAHTDYDLDFYRLLFKTIIDYYLRHCKKMLIRICLLSRFLHEKSAIRLPQLYILLKYSCLLLVFEDMCVLAYNMKTLNHKGRLSKRGKTQKDCNHLGLLYCTRATCNYLQALQKHFYSSTHFARWETESILWNEGQYRKFL